MCGIVGVGRFTDYGIGYKEREIFTDLLIAGSLRGTDGTGAFIVDSTHDVRTLKITGQPFGLLLASTYDAFFNKHQKNFGPKKPQDRFLVGHNRHGTVGKNTTENAHPHVVGDITLVHNGTLREYSKLPKMKDFDVDSCALANAIQVMGVEEAIANTHGAYAIVYYNKQDKTLNFLRNSERPLCIAVDIQMNKLYFASEQRMLEWVLARNAVNITKDVEISMLPEDTLLSFEQDNIIPQIRKVKGPKISTNWRQQSWIEYAELEFVDRFLDNSADSFQPPAKSNVIALPDLRKDRRIEKGLKKLKKKLGINIKPIKEFKGLKAGDQLVFQITDYTDEIPEQEKFLVMGTAKTLHDTSIRFKLRGLKAIDTLFECGMVIATIKNILEYPTAEKGEDKYVIWVDYPAPYYENETYPGVTYDTKGQPIHH